MTTSRFTGRRLLFTSVALVLPLVLAACGTPTDPDTATGQGALVSSAGESQIISQEVQAQIAKAAASTAASLQTLQEAQAPIATPVVSNDLTPSTTQPAPGLATPMPVAAQAMAGLPSADPNPDHAYVPPVGMGTNTPGMMSSPAPVPPMTHVSLVGLPLELTQPLTIHWTGNVAGALQDISQRIGYQFTQTGTDTGSHPAIFLDATNQPVADVLQNIGLQVQHYGHVNVDPATKTITLTLN